MATRVVPASLIMLIEDYSVNAPPDVAQAQNLTDPTMCSIYILREELKQLETDGVNVNGLRTTLQNVDDFVYRKRVVAWLEDLTLDFLAGREYVMPMTDATAGTTARAVFASVTEDDWKALLSTPIEDKTDK